MNTFTFLARLGITFSLQCRMKEAEDTLLRALCGQNKLLDTEHPFLVVTLNGLAFLYSIQGRLEEAKAMYHRVIQIQERHWGSVVSKGLCSLKTIALMNSDQHNTEKTDQFLWDILKISGQNNRDYLSTQGALGCLGELDMLQGKLPEAENILLKALGEPKRLLGVKRLDSLYTMTGLADLYLSQEKLQEAEALCLKVVRGYEETLGRDIITTAFALLQLGSVYLAQRRFEEAKKIYLEILKKPMRKPGLEPHLAMFAALDLGWLYHIRGRFRGAESMFRRALGGFEVWLGPNHKQTLVLVSRLGHLCMEQDRADKAEPLLARALHGYEETIGPAGFAQSREALEAVADMGMLRLSQDQQREARGYLRRAHDGYMSLLGPDHARTRQPQTVLRELEWLSVFD